MSDAHPSVEQVFERVKADFPTTSLATLYKTVTLLKQLDEVLELGFADSGNRYDGNKPYPILMLFVRYVGTSLILSLMRYQIFLKT